MNLARRIWWSPDERTVALFVTELLPEGDPSTAITHNLRTSLVTVDVRDSRLTRLVTENARSIYGGDGRELVRRSHCVVSG